MKRGLRARIHERLTLCRQRPLVAAWSSGASRLGIACNWLHLPTLGRTLYRVAVCPPHTVGRWRWYPALP